MTHSSGPLQEIARFAANEGQFERLPSEVVDTSKEMMVNAAAVGLAGAAQEEGQTLTRFVQDMGGNGRCTIIGKGLRTSPVYGALTNGMLVHLLDFDDEIPANGCQPGSAIFPVVMALGEMEGLPGREVLAAFAVGCEVTSKVQSLLMEKTGEDAGKGQESAAWGSYPSTLGATVAAASLLGLTEEQMLQAMMLTFQPTPVFSHPNEAGPLRAFRQGQSAMSGITAALLVHRGLKGVPGESSSANSRLRETSQPQKLDSNKLGQSLGQPFDIVTPGVGLKLYPCATAAHTVIDAAVQLVQQYRLTVGEIAAVHVGVTPSALAALPYPTPADGWEARACISFAAASALTYGQPLIDNFTDAAAADPRIRQLMDLITVEANETSLPSIEYPCSLTVTLRNGRQLRHRVEFARGLAELPLAPEELDAKFLYCSRYILPPDHIEEAITRLRDLENIDNTTGLFSVLGG